MKGLGRRLVRALRRQRATASALDPLVLAAWHLRRAALRRRERVSPLASCRIHPRPEDVRGGLWRLDLLRGLGLRRQRDLVGLVRDGDWDLAAYPLAELGIFEAIRQRFEDGVPWEEIAYFDAMRRSVDAGHPRFKYRTPEDIPRQWRRIEDLHDRIRRQGFRSQQELGSRRPWDEITIALDRHGRLLFLDGRHRLAIARVLGCPRVPVLVGLRHGRWEELRHELGSLARDGGILLPAHPDLPGAPWPPARDPLLGALLPHLPAPPGPVLDLEPGFGYWCQQLEGEGYETAALAGPLSARLDTLRLGCRLQTRVVAPPAADEGFACAVALGNGGERFWQLDEEVLRRHLDGVRVRHLVLRLPAESAQGAAGGEIPRRIARLLGLHALRELAPSAGGGRLVLLSEARQP